MDENRLPRQFFRRGVGNAATPSSSLAQTWQATDPLPACHFRCDLLRSAHRLPPLATCQPISLRGKSSSLTFDSYDAYGTWTLLLRALQRAERERQGRNPHRSRAIMDAASVSRPLRSLPGSAALMPAENGTSWLIPWAFPFPST
jgi:hypothetical protein